MKIKKLIASRTAGGAAVLIASTMIAQAIALAATPVLARLYPPEAFGYLALVVSASSLVTPIVALRLESALLLPKSRADATAILALGVLSAFLLSLLTAVGLEVAFAAGALSNMSQFPGFAWWVGGITFASGLFGLLGQFALRAQDYKAVAKRNVTQASGTALSQFGLVFLLHPAFGLVFGYSIGRLFGLLPLVVAARKSMEAFKGKDLGRLLGEYRQFPLIFTPSALLNSASLMLPLLFAGAWFNVADAGQWGMAERILALPIVLISAVVGQVVEVHFSQKYREKAGGVARFYLRTSGLLAMFGVIVGLAVWFAAPSVVPWVLGEGWDEASIMMQLMIPMLMTRLVASPMSRVLVSLRRASLNLALDALRFTMVAGMIGTAVVVEWTVFQLVLSISIVFAFIYTVTWIAGARAACRHDEQVQDVLVE